jgi:hypothetical protein
MGIAPAGQPAAVVDEPVGTVVAVVGVDGVVEVGSVVTTGLLPPHAASRRAAQHPRITTIRTLPSWHR